MPVGGISHTLVPRMTQSFVEDLPSLLQVLLVPCTVEKPSGTALGCHHYSPLVPSADKEWWQVPERWRCSDTHQAGRHSNPSAEHADAGVMPSGCGFVTTVLSWQSVAVMLEPEPGLVTYHQHLWPLLMHRPQPPPFSMSPTHSPGDSGHHIPASCTRTLLVLGTAL